MNLSPCTSKQELQYKRGIGEATLGMGHASNDWPQVLLAQQVSHATGDEETT
jgi:hypothetical protein